MGRFAIEHLPRVTATYDVSPASWEQAKQWLEQSTVISAVRTTEMITAIKAGMDVALTPSPSTVAIHPGDEALLITLSFGVLLAWAEQEIAPLPEDWRCMLLRVQAPSEWQTSNSLTATISEELPGEPIGESLKANAQANSVDYMKRPPSSPVILLVPSRLDRISDAS